MDTDMGPRGKGHGEVKFEPRPDVSTIEDDVISGLNLVASVPSTLQSTYPVSSCKYM